jgi:hypothetical protein
VYEKRLIGVLLLGSPRSRNHTEASRTKSKSGTQALIPPHFSPVYFLLPNQPENQPPPVLPPEADEEDAPPADDFPPAFFFSCGGLKTLRISTMRRSKTCSVARRLEHIILASGLVDESDRENEQGGRTTLTDVLVVLGRSLDEASSQLLSYRSPFVRLDLSTHHPHHINQFHNLSAFTSTPHELARKQTNSPHPAQIALLPDNDTTHLLHPLEVQDLVVQRLDHLKGLAARDRVDEDVPVDPYRVFVVEEGVFVLQIGNREGRRAKEGKKREAERIPDFRFQMSDPRLPPSSSHNALRWGVTDLPGGIDNLALVRDPIMHDILVIRALDCRVVRVVELVLHVEGG